jgi:hypothetical protein
MAELTEARGTWYLCRAVAVSLTPPDRGETDWDPIPLSTL